jgi:hypothetical protein
VRDRSSDKQRGSVLARVQIRALHPALAFDLSGGIIFTAFTAVLPVFDTLPPFVAADLLYSCRQAARHAHTWARVYLATDRFYIHYAIAYSSHPSSSAAIRVYEYLSENIFPDTIAGPPKISHEQTRSRVCPTKVPPQSRARASLASAACTTLFPQSNTHTYARMRAYAHR